MKEKTLYEKRWIEIQFVYLICDLQAQLNNYPFVIEYVELLADLAREERSSALRAIQAVTGMNKVRPSRAEVIYLANHFKLSVRATCKILSISNALYYDLKDKILESDEFYIRIQSDDDTIDTMEKLIKVHNKLKGLGI